MSAYQSIAVLIATGVIILEMRGALHGSILLSSRFWGSRFGAALAWKLAAVRLAR